MAVEVGLGETGMAVEVGLGETGLGETGLGETGLGETGLGETGLGETGLPAGNRCINYAKSQITQASKASRLLRLLKPLLSACALEQRRTFIELASLSSAKPKTGDRHKCLLGMLCIYIVACVRS